MSQSSTVAPVFLDGPLEGGAPVRISAEEVEQGIYAVRDPAASDTQVVYTFTKVAMFGSLVVVASVGTSIPGQGLLWKYLLSDAAKAAEL